MTSRSKTHYQGMQLKRVHRSEYDDTKLRDLARQDAKLGQDLKQVERAKNVMMKSMDADKQLFIKAGAQANSKMTRSVQGNWPRQNNQTTSPHSRLVSDTRAKRSSTSDEPTFANGSRGQSGSKSEKPRSGSGSGSRTGSTSTNQGTEPSTPEASSIYDTGSLYDKIFEGNTGNISSTKSSANDQDVKANKLGGSGRGMAVISEGSVNGKTTTIRHSATAEGELYRQGSFGDENGLSSNSQNRKAEKEQDGESGRRQSVWEALSTPKYTSTTKSKRSQIEKEFASPKLKNSHSSPSLLSSAGKGKSGTGQRKTSRSGSGSQQGRQVDGVRGRQAGSNKARNDT